MSSASGNSISLQIVSPVRQPCRREIDPSLTGRDQPISNSWALASHRHARIGNMAITTYQEKTHFAFWAALNSPSIIYAVLSEVSHTTLAALTNKDIIALNQDPLGQPATNVDHLSQNSSFQIWAGKNEGGYPILLLNEKSYPQTTALIDF